MPALANLYVDMCPRGWSETDNEWDDPGGLHALPLERLYQSAQHHDPIEERVGAAIEDYLDH